MDKEQQTLLKLLAMEAGNDIAVPEVPDGLDWLKMLSLAAKSRVEGLIYSRVESLPAQLGPPEELLGEWKQRVVRQGCAQLYNDRSLAELLAVFKKQGLGYTLFKGPVLAELYKAPSLRFSCDYDIFVTQEDLPQAEGLLAAMGGQYLEAWSKQHVSNWQMAKGTKLEIHTRLSEDYLDRRSVALEGMGMTEPQNQMRLNTHIGQVTTMEHTNHLLYQIYHIAKHITYRGIMLRNFIDLTLFVNRYMDEIDIGRFWEGIEALGYTKLCGHMLAACAFYFGIDQRILPANTVVAEQDVNGFMEGMMLWFMPYDSGEVGGRASSFIFQSVMRPKEHMDSQATQKTNHVIRGFLFPPPRLLTARFGYAKKHPVLLPIAWVHRIISALCSKEGFAYVGQRYDAVRCKTDFLEAYELLS